MLGLYIFKGLQGKENQEITPSQNKGRGFQRMITRKEAYKRNRKDRIILAKKGIAPLRKRCKYCGCYIEGRHKIWCESEEAKKIKAQLVDRLSTAIAWG